MKDALGHGSAGTGAIAEQHGIPAQHMVSHAYQGMSDSMYHSSLPPEKFNEMVGDMLGMWSGSQKSEPLSASEKTAATAAYNDRQNFRAFAAQLHDQRTRGA